MQELEIPDPKIKPTLSRGVPGILFVLSAMLVFFYVTRSKAPDTSGMPANESAFVNTIQKARSVWHAAPNGIAQAPMQSERASAICSGEPTLAAKDWTGTIQNVETNALTDQNGKVVATVWIALAPNIALMTPRTSVVGDPAAEVEAGSAIYKAAGLLRTGSQVKFSGQFVPKPAACVTEMSMTANGAMTDPEFEIKLTALASTSG